MSKDLEKEIIYIRIYLKKIETEMKNSRIERSHYKADEACHFLNCSRNTLNAICVEYDIYPVKVLGVYYYKIEDLRNVLVKKAS